MWGGDGLTEAGKMRLVNLVETLSIGGAKGELLVDYLGYIDTRERQRALGGGEGGEGELISPVDFV